MSLIPIIIILILLVGALIFVTFKLYTFPILPSYNPGVSVKDQIYCNATENPKVCCKCDDWQGDGIVPRKNAALACRSGKCDGDDPRSRPRPSRN